MEGLKLADKNIIYSLIYCFIWTTHIDYQLRPSPMSDAEAAPVNET